MWPPVDLQPTLRFERTLKKLHLNRIQNCSSPGPSPPRPGISPDIPTPDSPAVQPLLGLRFRQILVYLVHFVNTDRHDIDIQAVAGTAVSSKQ